jgi:hypothetical protein
MMPFINDGTTTTSFAEYQDVVDADQRLFEANEGLTDDIVEHLLVRSTARILSLIRASDWWRDLYLQKFTNHPYANRADVPDVNINRIVARQDDFTDLCVYYALWNYILPKIADFSKEDNAERAKIGFYQGKFQFLFDELINAGDWYDITGDGNVSQIEKLPGNYSLKRVV